jgi:hypothetical protein
MDNNANIEDFLDYYLDLEIAPEYAVLITGEWGAGKTWFIKKYIERKNIKYIWVSLNGVSSYKEIEDIFFEQLYPALNTKGAKIAGKVLKGLLKTTINIDLNRDGKDDAKMTFPFTDITLPNFVNDIGDRVLIFDDLERSSLEINKVLGYINQFVEDNGYGVILIANECEIIKLSNNDSHLTKYSIIKEKVIGRTFKIKPSFEQAIKSFLSLIDKKCKSIIENNITILINTYKLANYNNLRHLRYTIIDFELFHKYIPKIAFENIQVAEHILKCFFAISFELKNGKIQTKDIFDLQKISFEIDRSKPINSEVSKIKSKYEIFNQFSKHPISAEQLQCFFEKGFMDTKEIENTVLSSSYYTQEPKWRLLWRHFELEDLDFQELYEEVFQRFTNKETEDKYEVIQLTGIFLRLIRDKIIDEDPFKIIEIAKENFRKLISIKKFKINKLERFPWDHSDGLTYQSLNEEIFKDFLVYAKEIGEEISNSIDISGNDLLDILNKSVDEFENTINLKDDINAYYDKPVLNLIPVSEFVKSYFNLENIKKRDLNFILHKRYMHFEHNLHLLDELNWLIELENYPIPDDNNSGSISKYYFEIALKNVLNNNIKILEKIRNENF